MYGTKNLTQDFRLRMLKVFPDVSIKHLEELGSPGRISYTAKFVENLFNKIAYLFRPKAKQEFFYNKKLVLYRNLVAKYLETLYQQNFHVVVCFDWIMSTSKFPIEIMDIAINSAHEYKYPIISLPHGDNPHYNKLIMSTDYSFADADVYKPTARFDEIVVPNELCARRYYPHKNQEHIHIVGSPRYNQSWLEYLHKQIPVYQNTQATNKLKIIMFLRPSRYLINVEEISGTIKMLSLLNYIHLIIVPHTREEKDLKKLDIPSVPHVQISEPEIYASSLILWADVILDLATSISFEAIKLHKNVLTLEYLHGNVSTIGKFMPSTAVFCRDELLEKLSIIQKSNKEIIYTEQERETFCRTMIDIPGVNVLDNIQTLLNHFLNQ